MTKKKHIILLSMQIVAITLTVPIQMFIYNKLIPLFDWLGYSKDQREFLASLLMVMWCFIAFVAQAGLILLNVITITEKK